MTGATVHYVNEIPDGGEIIAQRAVEVLPGDTPEILQRRVMERAEWLILPEAAEAVAAKLEGSKMKMESLFAYLAARPYPGRGIMLALRPLAGAP